MVFCVAGVGVRDIVLCLQNVSNVILCDRRNTFERFAEIRGRRSTLDVWRSEFSANRIVRAASSGENVQIPWTSDKNGNVMSGVSPKSVSQESFPKSVSQECHVRSVGKIHVCIRVRGFHHVFCTDYPNLGEVV